MWDKFSPAEMGRRWELARGLMRQHDLIGLLVFGNSGVNRHNEANIFWLTNHLDLHHNYLVAPLDENIEAALYTGLTNHVPNARQVSDIPVIEWGRYHPPEQVIARLEQTGMAKGRLGIVGVNHKFGMGMPYQHYQALQAGLPDIELVDVTLDYTKMRTIKSEEEIVWLRKAAAFTDRTIYALQEQIRPGMTDYSLLGIIEGAYRADGGIPHIAFLRSMAMDDPNGCLPAQNPSNRVIQKGDVVITEISASYWGYSGQIHRPIFIGADPTPEWQKMFDAGLAAYENMAAAIRPGANEADVIRAASVIGEQGYAIYDDLIHGYGVDIHPPLIDRSCVNYWPWDDANPAPAGRHFEKNMAIVIQPNPITPDESMGLQLGALTVVTQNGTECLHQVPFEPLVVKI
ncbi:MAG: Xaa-Pro peptidase family protein [Anaerolineae bacterium]|nr:Xaa-Pro peptidase family protein [Anaerolineae bacterium]